MDQSLTIYCYSRCSTCRKALSWLSDQGIAHTVVDITTEPPSRQLLEQAVTYFGDRKPLFNTSGQSYRALGSAVVKAMGDQEALDALAADGKLIKRPFLALENRTFLVGFKPEVWSDALLG